MPASHAILYVIVSQTVCGLFLALAFGVGHNGELLSLTFSPLDRCVLFDGGDCIVWR